MFLTEFLTKKTQHEKLPSMQLPYSVSDDLDISPDFYEYFSATYRVLSADPTLWCVSAWNDNGKRGMVQDDPGI